MGIDKNRFLGDYYLVFLCPGCKDVSIDPILSPCCESTFCDACWKSRVISSTDKCPTCGRGNCPIVEKRTFQKQLTRVYLNLTMKCTERACGETLTVSNYAEHDASCPLKTFHCYQCGYKGRMMDSKDHDCVRSLKQEKNQLRDEVLDLKIKLKQAQTASSLSTNSINVIHYEEVDRVIKGNIELKKRLQELSSEKEKLKEELKEAVREKIHLQEIFNSTVRLLNASLVQKSKVLNGYSEQATSSKSLMNSNPTTSHCFMVTSETLPSSSTLSLASSTTTTFASSLPTICIPKETDLVKEAKVVFVEEATRAKKEVKSRVSTVMVDVFKSNANQGLNIQRKCLEVSKELKKSLNGTWYTFSQNHFNPQGFRPLINTFLFFRWKILCSLSKQWPC